MNYLSLSEKDTVELGKKFAKTLKGGDTVLLVGELGVGKTHFCKGIAKGLGVKESVTSPTFTLHNVYYGKLTLNHFDFYRLSEEEGESLGFEETIGEKGGVSVIEWPFNCPRLIPPSYIKVTLSFLSEKVEPAIEQSFRGVQRQIEIEQIGAKAGGKQ